MMIDRLEPRLQFASISGQIYTDADGSKTFDAGESARRGTTVFIDANANGTFDGGEQSTTVDRRGRYTFTGLDAGDYLIGTTTDTDAFKSTDVGLNGTREGRFDIEIRGLETASPAVRAAFIDAENRWESVILGDMPDVKQRDGSVIDDMVITATVGPIDGLGGILGYADSTELRRDSSFIPYRGIMRFDSVDMPGLQAGNNLGDVILHEMGHALGFGTIWNQLDLLTGRGSRNPRFVGETATAEYNRIYETNNLSVPIENGGGGGTRNSHWRESVLGDELMTGYSAAENVEAPLSGITVGHFADEGYEVDLAAADEWDPVTNEVTRTTALDLGGVANERKITVADTDTVSSANFGYIAITAPVIRSFTINPSPVAAGTDITLTATAISDADGDTLESVTFWRESNGIEGLQKDSDIRLVVRTVAKRGLFRVQTSTTGLLGDTTYYATATDSTGRTGRRVGVVNIANVTAPESRPNQLSVRTRSESVVRFAFVDPDTNVDGYRIELASRSTFTNQTIIRAFNITSESTSTTIRGLQEGQTYYVRVRAFNLAGVSQYSAPLAFETI